MSFFKRITNLNGLKRTAVAVSKSPVFKAVAGTALLATGVGAIAGAGVLGSIGTAAAGAISAVKDSGIGKAVTGLFSGSKSEEKKSEQSVTSTNEEPKKNNWFVKNWYWVVGGVVAGFLALKGLFK